MFQGLVQQQSTAAAAAKTIARQFGPGVGADDSGVLRHAALHARAEAFPLGLGVLTGKGVTTWRRTLADLIPAMTPVAAPPPRATAPGLPATAARELTGRPGGDDARSYLMTLDALVQEGRTP